MKNIYILLSGAILCLIIIALSSVNGWSNWPNQGGIRQRNNVIIDGQNIYMCWRTANAFGYLGPSLGSSDLYQSRLVPPSYRGGPGYRQQMHILWPIHQYPGFGENVICVDLKTGNMLGS